MRKETKGNSIDYSGLERSKSQQLVLFCPLQGAIDVISKKWALLIINEIGNHKRIRFSELRSELKEITTKSLSTTLEGLKSNDLIIRETFNEIPPRVEYSLTRDYLEKILSSCRRPGRSSKAPPSGRARCGAARPCRSTPSRPRGARQEDSIFSK